MEKLVNLAQEKQAIHISDLTTCDIHLRDKTVKGDACEALKQTIKCEIQKELLEWVYMQPPEHYEKLPENSSKLTFFCHKYISLK